MSFVSVYARLYVSCLVRAISGVKRAPWTLLLPWACFVLHAFTLRTIAQLFGLAGAGGQLIGGFAAAIASAAVLSGYFYFVGELVAESKVSLAEFRRALGAYLWSFVNLAFVLWVVNFVTSRLFQGPSQAAVTLFVSLASFVLLNAAPEIIYQRGTSGGLATVQGSMRFIQATWIEWFIPNLAIAAGLWFGVSVLWDRLPYGPVSWAASAVAGALLHVFFLFRGHLFKELGASSHRQRMYRYRA
ncbi:MAG: hypothetical protein ACKVPX_13135 [Myxococcaceae bacterium]